MAARFEEDEINVPQTLSVFRDKMAAALFSAPLLCFLEEREGGGGSLGSDVSRAIIVPARCVRGSPCRGLAVCFLGQPLLLSRSFAGRALSNRGNGQWTLLPRSCQCCVRVVNTVRADGGGGGWGSLGACVLFVFIDLIRVTGMPRLKARKHTNDYCA